MTEETEAPQPARQVNSVMVLAARLVKQAKENLKQPVPPEVEALAAIDPLSVPNPPRRKTA